MRSAAFVGQFGSQWGSTEEATRHRSPRWWSSIGAVGNRALKLPLMDMVILAGVNDLSDPDQRSVRSPHLVESYVINEGVTASTTQVHAAMPMKQQVLFLNQGTDLYGVPMPHGTRYILHMPDGSKGEVSTNSMGSVAFRQTTAHDGLACSRRRQVCSRNDEPGALRPFFFFLNLARCLLSLVGVGGAPAIRTRATAVAQVAIICRRKRRALAEFFLPGFLRLSFSARAGRWRFSNGRPEGVRGCVHLRPLCGRASSAALVGPVQILAARHVQFGQLEAHEPVEQGVFRYAFKPFFHGKPKVHRESLVFLTSTTRAQRSRARCGDGLGVRIEMGMKSMPRRFPSDR